jgi:hypothetical protein
LEAKLRADDRDLTGSMRIGRSGSTTWTATC